MLALERVGLLAAAANSLPRLRQCKIYPRLYQKRRREKRIPFNVENPVPRSIVFTGDKAVLVPGGSACDIHLRIPRRLPALQPCLLRRLHARTAL